MKYSPEIQEQKCRDWCDQRGIPVVRVIQDILVSGGDPNRFKGILESLTTDRPTHFVVADISRWTRDTPKRYWVIRSLIEDGGATLVSVDQEYLNDSEMPFSATLTTAQVEMNHQERMVLKRKTSAGMREARKKGKRWGRIWGWTFDEQSRRFVVDEPKIRALYAGVLDGLPYREIARRLGILWSTSIPVYIRAESQKDVVGEETWLRAQEAIARRYRAPRANARWSSIYRGLLVGACGEKLVQVQHRWGNYRCTRSRPHPQPFSSVSAPRHVTPRVLALLDGMVMPDDDAEALHLAGEPPEPMTPDPFIVRRSIERITLAWADGNLSQETYESRLAALHAQLEDPVIIPPRPPAERVAVIREMRRLAPYLSDQDPEIGDEVNRMLREMLYPIHLGWDKEPVEIRVREEYRGWLA